MCDEALVKDREGGESVGGYEARRGAYSVVPESGKPSGWQRTSHVDAGANALNFVAAAECLECFDQLPSCVRVVMRVDVADAQAEREGAVDLRAPFGKDAFTDVF